MEQLGVGVVLRHLLLFELERAGARGLAMADLATAIERHGYEPKGRPGKAISDALRTEVRLGRAIRIDRGHYRIGTIPRTSHWRMRRTVREHSRSAAARP